MTRRTLVVGAVVVACVVALGGLYASNMGFKLNYRLAATGDAVPGGTSANGTNTLALPFNRQSGVNTASALFDDIGSANVVNIQRYVQSDNSVALYASGGTDFNLNKGEGYFIRMASGLGVDYIVVGSHDPSFAVTLAGGGQPVAGGSSANGTNFFAFPYHGTATNAQELADDIGSTNVTNIQKFNPADNSIAIFAPGGASPFALTPGEAYFVRINSGVTVNYTPSHY